MPPQLPPDALERAREVGRAAPPMSDALIRDLRLIIWGPAAAVPAEADPAEAA